MSFNGRDRQAILRTYSGIFPSYNDQPWSSVTQRRAATDSPARNSSINLDLYNSSPSPVHPPRNDNFFTPIINTISPRARFRVPFLGQIQEIPPWSAHEEEPDLEEGGPSWAFHARPKRSKNIIHFLFGSRIDRKIRNPGNCSSIGYKIQNRSLTTSFLWRLIPFIIMCLIISLFHTRLGLKCGGELPGLDGVPNKAKPPNRRALKSRYVVFAEGLVAALGCFVLAQGHFSLRATRERMERVKQTAITMTYSLLKTTTTNNATGYDNSELQLVVYECLALTVAYPVALLQQMRDNTCEPAITKYCHEAAAALRHLRLGGNADDRPYSRPKPWSDDPPKLVPVEHFFEIFSLQLEKEFRKQPMRTKIPSMGPQHIIYCIRNHFENLIDGANLDERRAPIIRENIDMMALAGRECSVFAYRDVAPIAFLWAVDGSMRLIALVLPAQHCDYIINSPRNTAGEMMFPTAMTILAMVGISAISSIILVLLQELWNMWDPFGRGINTFSWTLGIAREIDDMLNEYAEDDEKYLIRVHSYIRPVFVPDASPPPVEYRRPIRVQSV